MSQAFYLMLEMSYKQLLPSKKPLVLYFELGPMKKVTER